MGIKRHHIRTQLFLAIFRSDSKIICGVTSAWQLTLTIRHILAVVDAVDKLGDEFPQSPREHFVLP